jgi:hypothetical protein
MARQKVATPLNWQNMLSNFKFNLSRTFANRCQKKQGRIKL